MTEAYQTAVEHLKIKPGISLSDHVPIRLNASVENAFIAVEAAKKDHEDKKRKKYTRV